MPPRRLQISRLVYWIAVSLIFGMAAWQRFSLPLDPIADPDTWGYLAPALNLLTGSGFTYEGRNFLYPGFVWLLPRLFGDFRAITIAQHFLGLVAGALLLLTWRRARMFVRESRLPRGGHEVFGLILAAIFLVAGESLRTEMQIRPEGVCAFLLSLNLWFAFEFVTRAFVVREKGVAAFGIGTAVSAIVLASLKPSFIFLALISVVPLGIFLLMQKRPRQKIVLGLGVVVAAIVLLLPEYFLSRNDELGRTFLPTTLFVVHADMIRDQMADDLVRDAKLPYAREWLNRVHAELTEEIAKSAAAEPEHYFSLGFSPDYLMYQETSIAVRLAFEFEDNPAALIAFYRFYYWRTWRQQPFAMLEKVVRQMALFYAPVCPAYNRSKYMPLTEAYQFGVSSLNRHTYPNVWKRHLPAVEFMSRTESLAQNAPSILQRRVLRRVLTFLARAYLPLLGITLLIAAAAFLRRNPRHRLGWLAAITSFVFSYNAAACLEVAILNSLEVPRYSTVQFSFTLLAEFLAAWLLLEALVPRIRWGRPIQTSAPGE
jgi:hypothetical protein